MASNVVRTVARQAPSMAQRAISTSTVRSTSQVMHRDQSDLPMDLREQYYPKIGSRDIVGPGHNNLPNYMDREDFPCPAIRWKENDPEVMALREKEKGDWTKLSIEEKKALYRASFRKTFAEIQAPTGEWKSILAAILGGFTLTGWLLIYIKKFVMPAMPSTITSEWQEKQLERMVKLRANPFTGISSKYDYEKNAWK